MMQIQDLILDACPLGCDGSCPEKWINESIDHKIICRCKRCQHDKKEVEGGVKGSAAPHTPTVDPPDVITRKPNHDDY